MFPLSKHILLSKDANSFANLDLRLQTEIPLDSHPGAFGVLRRHHIHEGVDLYACLGDEVLAIEDGEIVSMGPFTGPQAGSPWWLPTEFVMVQGQEQVLCYGELRVAPALAPGQRIREGMVLGRVATVLRHDKGRPRNMLHLERYALGVRVSCGIWPLGAPRPEGLLDPTPVLLQEAAAVRDNPVLG